LITWPDVLVIAVGVTADPAIVTVKSAMVALPDPMGPFIVTTTMFGVSADTKADAIANSTELVAVNAT
jgi:hypothetical protein